MEKRKREQRLPYPFGPVTAPTMGGSEIVTQTLALLLENRSTISASRWLGGPAAQGISHFPPRRPGRSVLAAACCRGAECRIETATAAPLSERGVILAGPTCVELIRGDVLSQR